MKVKRTRRSSRNIRRTKKNKLWQLQEAKAKFSQVINEAISSGYQTITKNGKPVAYIVSKVEFDRYLPAQKTLLEAVDSCPYPEIDLDIARKQDSIREIEL